MFKTLSIVTVSFLSLFAGSAAGAGAQDGPPEPGVGRGARRRAFAAQSIAACQSLIDGATCQIGEVTGHCRTRPARGERPALRACVPAALEARFERSLQACQGVADGGVCSVDGPRGVVPGHCRAVPHSRTGQPAGQLMCMPAHIEERLERSAAACRGQAAGSACSMTGPRGSVAGTCQARVSAVMCVPSERRGHARGGPRGEGHHHEGGPGHGHHHGHHQGHHGGHHGEREAPRAPPAI